MNSSDNRRWALVGPLSVVLWVVGIILINKNGPADASAPSSKPSPPSSPLTPAHASTL